MCYTDVHRVLCFLIKWNTVKFKSMILSYERFGKTCFKKSWHEICKPRKMSVPDDGSGVFSSATDGCTEHATHPGRRQKILGHCEDIFMYQYVRLCRWRGGAGRTNSQHRVKSLLPLCTDTPTGLPPETSERFGAARTTGKNFKQVLLDWSRSSLHKGALQRGGGGETVLISRLTCSSGNF